MNCIDFRRVILVNPRQISEDARAHAAECVACRETLERQLEADDRLFSELQVPVPDGLADRVLVSRGMRPAPKRWVWAMAATLVLAAGVAWFARDFLSKDPLGREAIAHVAHEPQSFTDVHAVGADFLRAVLAEQGVQAVQTLGQVTYARICPMDGRTARHIVVRTLEGPVTFFLMPDDPNRRQRSVTQGSGMAALTLPAAKGSLAIVAANVSQVTAVERALRMQLAQR
jgi:hypothetical protein